jgi:group I intron endonuclease
MFHFIYKTTNLLNSKYYIGVHSTDVIEDGYLGSGKRLVKAIKKYGKSSFSRKILEIFATRQEAMRREAEIVTESFALSNDNYNYAPGGGSTGVGDRHPCFGKHWKLSDETKAKIAESKRGKKNPMFGGLSKAHKEKLSNVMKVKARRGEDHPCYGTEMSTADKLSRSIKCKKAFATREKKKCPHCGVTMLVNLYARYHGDNCKSKGSS